MFTIGKPQPSHYIRTTWMLSAQTTLKFADFSIIRFFSVNEADKLTELVRKRNIFARHSWENNFYLKQAQGLANHTIIEVFRPGDPKDISEEAEEVATILEQLTVLSSTLVLTRDELQRKLGISSKPRTERDFIIGPAFRFLRSRARPTPTVKGICIDERFSKRFSRCGFDELAGYCLSNSKFAPRVLSALNWLFESKIEPRQPASVVKTSIALESLLIFSESESLAQSLSERGAFILSSDPIRRQQISRILKRFYTARSGIVHGSHKKRKLTPFFLEAVDRITILLCLVVAANSQLWTDIETLKNWCEIQRWGKPSIEIKIPFPDSFLRKAITLAEKGAASRLETREEPE